MNACCIAPLLITSLFFHAPQIVAQAAPPNSSQDRVKVSMIASRMGARLEGMRRSSQLPGIQVGFSYVDGVTPDGKPNVVSGSFASGVVEANGTALTTNDRMPIGSVANTFLAALALQLVEKGQLKFDEKISRWLGKEPWFSQLPNANDITLSMLLNQSSGIENHAANTNFQKQWLKSAGRNITRPELIAYVLNKKPLFPAGSDYAYSETNYVLAGMIIEKVTGKPIVDSITETFIKPNKLDRTTPANGPAIPGVATGYLKEKPVIVGGKFTINPQWEWAGGTFVSTAEDMARWAILLYGGDVLSDKAKDEMINSMTTGEGIIYGLGVVIARSKWGRTYGHDGEFPGYLSEIRYYTKYKLAISLLINSEETPQANRVLTTAVDDFADVIIQARSPAPPVSIDRNQLQKLAESWLSLVDAGEFEKAWNQMSERLKMRLSKEMWENLISSYQKENGKLKSRKLVTITSGRPERKLVAIQFDTEFLKRQSTATESLVLELEDGEWRITSYSIR